MSILSILNFTFNAILPLILLILLGYFLKTRKIISQEFVKTGNKVVFRICLPTLLFCNVAEIESIDKINWSIIGYVLIVIILLTIVGYAISFSVKEPNQKGVMMQCIYRSNFALIGVPLAELIAGQEGVQVAALLSIFTIPVFNCLSVIVLTAFVDNQGKGALAKQLKAIIKNPLIIGVLLGFVVMLLKNILPGAVVNAFNDELAFIPATLKYVSRTATPLALLVLGGQFEFKKVKGYRKQIVIATIGRTVGAPLIGVGIAAILTKMGVLNFSPAVFAALISLFGTPVAVASAIMAEEMKNDGQLAAQLVVWTSIVSAFTLFVTIFMCRFLGVI